MRVDEAGTARSEGTNPPPPVGTESGTRSTVARLGHWTPPTDLGAGLHAVRQWDGLHPPGDASAVRCCITGLDHYLEPTVAAESPVAVRHDLARLFADLHDALPAGPVHVTVGPGDSRTARAVLGLLRTETVDRLTVTLRVAADTPNVLVKEAVRVALQTGQPTFVGEALTTGDDTDCGMPHGDSFELRTELNLHSPTIIDEIRAQSRQHRAADGFAVASLAIDETATTNPSGIVDLIRGSLLEGLQCVALDDRLERTRAPGAVLPPASTESGTAEPTPHTPTASATRHRTHSPTNHDHTTRTHP